MKVHAQLFLCVIVATCQASLLQINRDIVARQGEAVPFFDQKEPDPKTLYVPNVYKPGHISAYQNLQRSLNSRANVMNRSVQLRPRAQANEEAQRLHFAKAYREAELAEIDKAALSKLSAADRHIIVSRFSQTERENLLANLDEVADVVQTDSRFAITNGFSGVVSQLGAGAGSYIGGKLAGALGAKLGAAAGAYLAAAAASRFDFSKNKIKLKDIEQPKRTPGLHVGGSYGGSYGAVLIKQK